LEHLANYDSLLRQILGLSPVQSAEEKPFHYKTLSENICHVDEELLQQINTIVAQHLYHSGEGSAGYNVSMTVQSSGYFVAERPMYWNVPGTQGGSDVIGYTGL